MRSFHKLLRVGRPMLLGWFLIGMVMLWGIPVMSADMTNLAVDCGQAMQVAAAQGKKAPGACPPADPWEYGWEPVPGAIQINPTGTPPGDAICEGASNNACSSPGISCQPGTNRKCKDTWDFVTHTCMCQCR